MSNINEDRLQQIVKKWNVPMELLETLLESSNSNNLNERKVGEIAELEDIISKFLSKKNDN